MSNVPLGGHIPALVTPLLGDGQVDFEVFARLVTRALDHGSVAVLVGGSTGEGPLVRADVRAHLVAAAVAAADGAGVVACVSGSSLDDVFEDVERAVSAGAVSVLALAPFYFPLSAPEHAAAQIAIADRSPVPVFTYHIPQMTGVALDADAVAELAAHPNMAGMKDSSGDLAGMRAFVAAGSGHQFTVFQGNGPLVLAALDAGAAGSITAIANVCPDIVAALHAAFDRGDRNEAAAAQDELTRVSAVLSAAPGTLAVAVKAALQVEGVIPERACLPPLLALSQTEVEVLAAGLRPPV